MNIDLKAECDNRTISRSDAREVARKVSQAMAGEEQITIDFNNMPISSVSFLDETIGRLALEYPQEKLKQKLSLKNIRDFDRALLNDILRSRYHQLKDEAQQQLAEKKKDQ